MVEYVRLLILIYMVDLPRLVLIDSWNMFLFPTANAYLYMEAD